LNDVFENTANIVVQTRIGDDIIAGVFQVTVDVVNKERDVLQLHARTQHIDDENVRYLIHIVLF
jgi:hypothetical protein